MVEKIKKIVIDVFGKEYELAGGGEGSQPAPNSVGSDEIKDKSIERQDLSDDIQNTLNDVSDENVVSESELEDSWDEALRNAGLIPVNNDPIDDDI